MQGAVGAVLVEVSGVLGQCVFEVAAVEDQHSVEQLAANGADPSLGDRVRPGRPHRCAQDTDTLAGEPGIEDVGELAIPIPDQEPEGRCAVAEVHQEIARLLSNPGAARVRGDSEETHAAGGVLYEEQDIKSLEQQRVDAEEVRGQNALV
jgi:hypothetical protein